VTLAEAEVGVLARRAGSPEGYELTADLVNCRVHDRQGFEASFRFDPYRREMLLKGLDEIGKTLLHEARIAAFERRRAALMARGSA
jgi:3-isopropylmalate/(R)-2-methylmalate dehydratase small subunit